MRWLWLLEGWATAQLLRSPAFHRMVHNVHRGVRRMKDGKSLEEMGGTNLDREGPSFLQHFVDELKDQLKGGPPKKK